MNSKKLDRAVLCLYAMCGLKVATALYTALTISSLNLSTFASDFMSVTSASVVLALAVCIFTIFVTQALKKQQVWGWIAGLSLFLFTLPSFALPASVIGILSLLDIEVRTEYLKQLDFKF
ncbi:MAG: hypothetical protein ACK4VO_07840 [Pseudobdellovibrio sp.]